MREAIINDKFNEFRESFFTAYEVGQRIATLKNLMPAESFEPF